MDSFFIALTVHDAVMGQLGETGRARQWDTASTKQQRWLETLELPFLICCCAVWGQCNGKRMSSKNVVNNYTNVETAAS